MPQNYFTLFVLPGQSASQQIAVTSASLAGFGYHTLRWTAAHTAYQAGTGETLFEVVPDGTP